MKVFVIVFPIIALICADPTDKQDLKSKPTPSTLNILSATIPKQEFYLPQIKYQQPFQLQQQQQLPIRQQYVPIQMMPRQYYIPQPQPPQPHAMIIIAQPALVPSSLVYGNNPAATQQLLHYIQQNQQMKYQPAPVQATYMHPILTTPNYILAPQQQQLAANPTTPTTTAPTQATVQQQHQQQPLQLDQLANFAQLVAQQYMTPLKTVTPIVTGFEHFTPEQQAQIKAQLTNHLGTNFHAVSSTSSSSSTTPTIGQYSGKYPVAEQGFIPSQPLNNNNDNSSKEKL